MRRDGLHRPRWPRRPGRLPRWALGVVAAGAAALAVFAVASASREQIARARADRGAPAGSAHATSAPATSVQSATAPAAAAPPASASPAAAPATSAQSAAAPHTAAPASAAPPASAPRRGVWFCGDFESGDLRGWAWDIIRAESAEVVTQPVRRGRYAVRITLAPGDQYGGKPRAELRVEDKQIERLHGRQGQELWYGWSLFLPAGYADPPGDQFQILGQWHHRPPEAANPDERPQVAGPPPLRVQLVSDEGRHVLALLGQPSAKSPPRTLGDLPIRLGKWIDLVFHIKCSTGRDGFVEAWLDGRPFTAGKIYGPTLYTPVSNYLRLGLYRGKGVPTTNQVFYDEVRIGDSYQAVAP